MTAIDDAHPNIKEKATHMASRWGAGFLRFVGPVCGSIPAHGALHAHPDQFEIHYLSSGELAYEVGERTLHLTPGTACVVPAGVLHGPQQGRFNQCKLWWCSFPRHFVDNQKDPDSPLLRGVVAAVAMGVVRVPPGMERSLEQQLECRRRRGPLRFFWTRNFGIEAILTACEAALLGEEAVGLQMTGPVLEAMARLEEHCALNEPIAAVAAGVDMSVRRFTDRFKAETGYTPQEYRQHVRIRRAKDAIGKGQASLTAIALELGFSSSQHFSTVFKKLTGMTPRDYAAEARDADLEA